MISYRLMLSNLAIRISANARDRVLIHEPLMFSSRPFTMQAVSIRDSRALSQAIIYSKTNTIQGYRKTERETKTGAQLSVPLTDRGENYQRL